MRKIIFPILCLLVFSTQSFAKDKVQAVKYYNNPFGNVHQNASMYSSVMTTVACGHPVKVYSQKMGSWVKVKVGASSGYMLESFLSSNRVNCFQDKFPRFFDQFQLGPTDLYYWGRLYDQYSIGKSKVKQ